MRITSFTDYGLWVPLRMAGAPGRGVSTAEPAREFVDDLSVISRRFTIAAVHNRRRTDA